MTLKELKKIIEGKRIDRVAGFCDSYGQMFDRCRVDVHKGSILIDTSFDDDNDDQFDPVPVAIEKLIAMPSKYDDYPVLKSGFDNDSDNGILVRRVISVMFEHSQSGSVGLSLLGRESIRFIDDEDFLDLGDVYHVEIVIEDPRAKRLNEKFDEFIYASCNWFRPDENCYNDEDDWSSYSKKDFTVITFVTDETSSAALIALIASAFDGAYFARTLLSKDVEVERLSNDREGKYFGPWEAVVFPAYIPGEDILHPKPGLTAIAGSACFVQECASKQEMEEFIASHNPDEAVGDIARRVTTRYVDDPLELILEKNYF